MRKSPVMRGAVTGTLWSTENNEWAVDHFFEHTTTTQRMAWFSTASNAMYAAGVPSSVLLKFSTGAPLVGLAMYLDGVPVHALPFDAVSFILALRATLGIDSAGDTQYGEDAASPGEGFEE